MESKNFFEEIFRSANQLADLLKGHGADTINGGIHILNYQIDSIIENVEIFLEVGVDYSKPYPIEVNYIKYALKQLKDIRDKEKELESVYGKIVVAGPKMGEVIHASTLGGKRKKTRKMRGGIRTRGAAGAASGSGDEGDNVPITSGKAIQMVNTMARVQVAKARANAATRKIRREEGEETARWAFKNIISGLVAAVSGVIGAGAAQYGAETSAYTVAVAGDAFVAARSQIPLVGSFFESPPLSEPVIPTDCLPIFLEGDAAYTPPASIKIDPTVKYPWQGTTAIVGEGFAQNVARLLEYPTITDWPTYQAEITLAYEAAETKHTTCKAGVSWYQFGDVCVDEKTNFDAKKLTYETVLETGALLTPTDLRYTSGDLITTISGLAKGTVAALSTKDRASAEKASELVTVFESARCSGLPIGTGTLKPELLSSFSGYNKARESCSNAIGAVLPEATNEATKYNPVVYLLADTLISTNDVRVSFARDNVMITNEQSDAAETFIKATDARKQRGKMGINLLLKAFEGKKSSAKPLAALTEDDRSKGELSKEDYAQIITNIRLVDLRGIKIPNDVAKVADYAESIENTYSSYIAAGRSVPMTGTREFFRQKYAKERGNRMTVTVMGGVGGLVIGGLLALAAKFALLGAATGPAVAAALGQRALNMLKLQQQNARELEIKFELKRQIADGVLDPREGMARLAAITNGKTDTITDLMKDVETVRRLENSDRRDRRKPRAPRSALPNAAPAPRVAPPALPNVAPPAVLQLTNASSIVGSAPQVLPLENAPLAGVSSRRRDRRTGGTREKATSFYQSETTSWSSSPKKGKTYGTRNVVTIKNGRGTKTTINIGADGKTLRRKTVKLSRNESKNVLGGKFMPGFWKNCTLGNCA